MLPEIRNITMPVDNFPAKWQAVIFRNYGYVSLDKIAKTLACSEETVTAEAARLGIENAVYDSEWEKNGYITTIRNNWYLLPYEQILSLLGISEQRLAFILEKDDFLAVKLGNFKPACEPVRYEPLTSAQIAQTEEIAKTVKKYRKPFSVKPFDFFPNALPTDNINADTRKNTRIVHGYLSPCGDPFAVDSAEYLPETLLQSYQAQGVSGVWLHGVLSALSPYPFDSSLCEGYELRRKNLKGLIARCKAHGLKVYLYFNEPRALPKEKIGKYAHLAGGTENGYVALCFEKQETREYLYNAVKDLLGEIPDLGGIITITMSENFTHCNYRSKTDCPICKHLPPENAAAEINNVIMRAIRDSGAQTELIANLWGWSQFLGWTEEQTFRGVEMLDKDISVLCVSEFDLAIQKGGIQGRIIDYSISNPGPSEITQKTLKKAKELGHKIFAKIQTNNSWECSTVPYLPVFDLTYEHLRNLYAIGVQDYMLTWTLGGCPSPTFDLVSAYSSAPENFSLSDWYTKIYGEIGESVHSAVEDFCNAFREYPFSIDSLYYSPKTLGLANFCSLEPENNTSTMVCYAYDDYDTWIKPYPLAVYLSQYEKLLQGWQEGMRKLSALKQDDKIRELARYAKGSYLHFRYDYLHTKFSAYKSSAEKKSELVVLLDEMYTDAVELLELMREDAKVGYEASNHYFYNERNIIEKLLNIQLLKSRL